MFVAIKRNKKVNLIDIYRRQSQIVEDRREKKKPTRAGFEPALPKEIDA